MRPPTGPAPAAGLRVGWWDLLTRWDTVLIDLHEIYGADWYDDSLVRPWPWWRTRIWGLLGSERSRLRREITPPPPGR